MSQGREDVRSLRLSTSLESAVARSVAAWGFARYVAIESTRVLSALSTFSMFADIILSIMVLLRE